ncbi:YgdI/YgdR family lipoprotein [Acerihabitans arboris]|uniref:YgdI/YgdR family lipoprotein n=1 Tax=Acerihabitans arboris TaxID=2691583 RepID=A0A845SRF4_9GAMM|nr:YgdI/YgdR family lipoprotein [Acerihabitans arboris]NDL65514.1 YgdI/YgdR family lipoprotein [Acerihabitans arboris]
MKKYLAIVAAVLLTAMLSGCASNYVMATKDGRMILTQGKPEVDKTTGLIRYTDEQGNEMQINGNDVSQMIER